MLKAFNYLLFYGSWALAVLAGHSGPLTGSGILLALISIIILFAAAGIMEDRL